MDTAAVIDLVDELQDNLEDLEDNLSSILTGSLAATSRKLPLLDRAKLNVLLVYSIESLLFSYLKIHGVQVKEHPVFRELTRVKQYFEKLKAAEIPVESAQPTATVNKEAAARVIKHGLAGNEKYDLERAEREAREKFLANRKLKDLESRGKANAAQSTSNDQDSTMTDALTQAPQLAAQPQEQPAEDTPDSESDDSSDTDEEGEVAEHSAQAPVQQGTKRKKSHLSAIERKAKRKTVIDDPGQTNEARRLRAKERQAARKVKKKVKKEAKKMQAAGL